VFQPQSKRFDGKTNAGTVTITNGFFALATTDGESLTIPFVKIQRGVFNQPTVVKTTVDEAGKNGALPKLWVSIDIGDPPARGKAVWTNNTFSFQAGGASFWDARPDSLFYAYRPLNGDGQISARLVSSGARAAGVMIRDSVAPDALFAAMAYQAGDTLIYRTRRSPGFRQTIGTQGDWHNRDYVRLPRWVRLRRQGNELRGFVSDDGVLWENFYRGPLELGKDALVGLFVISGNKDETKTAVIDNVTITEGAENLVATDKGSNATSVVLVNGTVVAGQIVSATSSTVKLQRQNRAVSIPTLHIARLLFQTFGTPTGGTNLPSTAGVLLARDDFLESEFAGVEQGKVQMNSVLFGARKYNTGQVKAVVLRPMKRAGGDYEVTSLDGSVWRSASVQLEEDVVAVSVPVIGVEKIPINALSEIRRGE
jgi:hypothetical protein